MLRLFQVNEGRFVDLEGELTPNSRVGEVCEGVRREGGGGVVLMVADGRQMEDSELVGAYSPGMEGKPIFVFYQRHLSSHSPPSLPSLLKPRPDLERGLVVLNQKPYPGLFQKLPPLAKQVSEYSSGLFNMYQSVREETQLQISGWNAVLRNCHRIIGVYEKHQQHFSRVLESFQSSRTHYLQLVNSFPEQVKLLQQLPVPAKTTLSPSSSLYDWISTHDEKNSLVDLCSECERVLAQGEDGQMGSALEVSRKLLSSCSLERLAIAEEDEEGGGREVVRAAELSQLQIRMMENIHSTSQRAMRSGDGGTVADLTVSHHRSLQLMNQQKREMEALVRAAETRKTRITQRIHQGLRVVTELQMKINESNSVLVFLHETLKLARKRFEVLEQVCSCGEVLGDIVAEVERRESFNHLFTERVVEVAEELRTVREDEKQKRHTFTSAHRHHFLTSLFPQLSHRLPDATCRLGRVPASSDTTDLSHIKNSLPPQLLHESTIADSFSTLLSRSLSGPSPLHHTPPRTSSYPQLKPRPPATPLPAASHVADKVEVEKLLAEASQTEQTENQTYREKEKLELTEQKRIEKEREKLELKVRDLEGKLAAVSEERDVLARKMGEVRESSLESAGFEVVGKPSFAISEGKREYSEKILNLEAQFGSVTAERDRLLKEREADRGERERERREMADSREKEMSELTKKLHESQVLRENLAKSMEILRQKESDLRREIQVMREKAAKKEREREEERAMREAELVRAVEEEKRNAAEQFQELHGNLSILRDRLQRAETTISEQKVALEVQTAELETANEAKGQLSEKCRELQDSLENKVVEMSSLEQRNMQWRGESEEQKQDNTTLRTDNEELRNELAKVKERLNSEKDRLVKEKEHEKRVLETNDELRSKVEKLNNENKYLKMHSGSLSDGARSLGSGEMTSSEQLQSDSSSNISSNLQWAKASQTCQAEVTQMKTENEKLKSENDALKSQSVQLTSKVDQLQSDREKLSLEVVERERDIAKRRSENDTLKSQNVKLTSKLESEREKYGEEMAEKEREMAEHKSKVSECESETVGMRRECEKLSSKLSEFEEKYRDLQDQSEREKVELTSNVAQLSSENERLESQSKDQQLRINSCLECQDNLQEVAELRKSLEEKEEELKRSEYRHQQAQKAYTSSKAQQETLRLRLVALEEERKGEGSATFKVGGEREREEERMEMVEKETGEVEDGWVMEGEGGRERGGGRGREREGGRKTEEREGGGREGEGGGTEMEGGGREGDGGRETEGGGRETEEREGGGRERGRNPQEEVKRLRTELAVERKNRSVVAEELQKVGRERDKFMQKFMEAERELRNRRHHHQQVMSESVMTASGSSEGSSGGVGDSGVGSKLLQRRINLTVSNLQVDDVALFCVDSFNNYLAMSVDGKTYYLNHSCVPKFSDNWTGKIKPPFEKKLLIGRVTQRLHVEVRKEDNRLHVPVGTRLYKLEAVELGEDSAA